MLISKTIGMSLVRCHVLWLCILLSPAMSFSQSDPLDSLQLKLKRQDADPLKSLTLVEIAFHYLGRDTLVAKQYLSSARELMLKHPSNYNWGYYYEIKSQFEFHRSRYVQALLTSDSAVAFYEKAEEDVKTRKDAAFRKAVVTADKGGSYNWMGRTEEAIEAFMKGLELYEHSDHPNRIDEMAACYNNIAICYLNLGQYEKTMEYDVKAVPYHLLAGDDESIAWAYISVASDFTRLESYDSAMANYDKAEPHVKRLNMKTVNREFYGRKGQLYWARHQWSEAIPFYQIAYEQAAMLHIWQSEAGYLRAIADCHYNLDNLEDAEAYALKSLGMDDKYELIRERRMVYNLLSLIYFKLKQYENAYGYVRKYINQNASINDEEQKKLVADLDRKYLKAQQDKEILQLQKDKEIQELSLGRRSLMNNVLIGSLCVVLVIGLLVFRNIQQRQKVSVQHVALQEQKIRELEKDKQLVAVDSMLQGQEEERSRMAKDLHDGLGGMLSGVKLSMGAMKGNMVLTAYNNTLFNTALDQIDQSITEMRRVAHSMMPEALVRLGLQQAVRDYCDGLSQSKLLQIKLQSHGLEHRLTESVEVVIYRIVQELLNNVVKHADATIVLVQIMRHNDNLNITIEDNGKGFVQSDPLHNSSGQGLKNVQYRVDYLKGQLDIQSIVGKGTSVHIDINLKS